MTSEPPSSPTAGPPAREEPVAPVEGVDPDAATTDEEVPEPEAHRQSVGRAGAIMAGGTFVSRVVGLVRAAMLTGVIGTTGYAADGFTAANTLPNSFYILIAGGALNAILVPQIVRAKLRPDGDEFVNRIITLSVAALFGATVLATLLAPLLVPLYYRTRSEEAIGLAIVFAYVCLPQIFFYGLYTLLGQVLNANGRFAGYMWAPALANVVAVVGLVVFVRMGFPQNAAPADWTPAMIAVLAGSATLSIVAQAVCLVIPLRRMGFRYRPVWGVRGVGLGEVSNVAKWTFGSIVVSQLGFLVTSNVLTRATDLGERAGDATAGLAAFNPALLLVMLPHGLVTVSLVTALYTRLSEAASRDDHAEVLRYHAQGLRMPSVILVPGVVLIGVLAPYVASTFFFTNSLEQTKAIAIVLQGLVWMVLPMAWTYLNDRVFYAHQMTWMSFRIQCVTTGLSSLGALIASRLDPGLTAFALSVGQSCAVFVSAGVGFWVLRRMHGHIGLSRAAGMYLRLLVPALVTAFVLLWVIGTVVPDLGERRGVAGLLEGGLVLGAAAAVQLAVTWTVARALGVTEVAAALEPLTRRLRRR
ncbi:murein biosynthesis integral membrane protein MurJ [Oryzobacter telluris]|uniref:murein biosynthesis integral membrane protein MurJ n=1 Tax=Oryzobacter telluris TaxID=3149179 RepID=UPI00370D6F7D